MPPRCAPTRNPVSRSLRLGGACRIGSFPADDRDANPSEKVRALHTNPIPKELAILNTVGPRSLRTLGSKRLRPTRILRSKFDMEAVGNRYQSLANASELWFHLTPASRSSVASSS